MPALVVQQTIVHVEADVTVAVQAAIVSLVETGHRSGQSHCAGNTPGSAVVDRPRRQAHGPGTGQATALLVSERAGVQHHTIARDTTALAVVETSTAERQLCISDNLPALIDDCAVEVEHACSGAGHTAIGVGQTGCFKVNGAVTAHHALIVCQHAAKRQIQRVFGVKAATAGIGQLPQVQLHALLPGHNPAQVIQAIRSQQQSAVGQQPAFFTVIELADVGCQAAEAGDFSIAVVQ
ncbi:hypothetical protein PSFL111601_13825 [Pseudomonas floridensis]